MSSIIPGSMLATSQQQPSSNKKLCTAVMTQQQHGALP
jgi:hypothetical protein